MSRALAVFHGRFGRATVYQLNRPFSLHAHREGHLIFHVGGTSGSVQVSDAQHRLDETGVVAVNPWEPHNFTPSDYGPGALFFVLYVDAKGFAPAEAPRRRCGSAAPAFVVRRRSTGTSGARRRWSAARRRSRGWTASCGN